MRKLLKKYASAPERLVTDDLRLYAPAARDLGIEHLHERGRWRNNRAENSRQPTRRRERKMQRFKSTGVRNNDNPDFASETKCLSQIVANAFALNMSWGNVRVTDGPRSRARRQTPGPSPGDPPHQLDAVDLASGEGLAPPPAERPDPGSREERAARAARRGAP